VLNQKDGRNIRQGRGRPLKRKKQRPKNACGQTKKKHAPLAGRERPHSEKAKGQMAVFANRKMEKEGRVIKTKVP